MRYLFWIFMICMAGICGCTETYQGFTLKGTIKGGENEVLYLNYTDSLGLYVQDSVLIKGGKFIFRGGITEPTYAALRLGKGQTNMDDPNVTNFWLEPAKMSLEGRAGDLKNAILKGSFFLAAYKQKN